MPCSPVGLAETFRGTAILTILIGLSCGGRTFASEPAAREPAAQPLSLEKGRLEGDLRWYDARLLGPEGQGWEETKAPYDRLPAKAEGVVRPPVWGLSRHCAGICVRFQTSSPQIAARWTLTSERLEMNHMPATGVSGLDLYVWQEDEAGGKWYWLATGRPTKFPDNQATLVADLSAEPRKYLLYLPLYNGVSKVELGFSSEHAIAPLPRPADRRKPIVFWGTSITQGGCASRTGMVHTAILGRRLDRPVINLGFSGNGKMEPEVAELVAEIDAAAYVIDCLPNMGAVEVRERVEPLVKILRQKRPSTPILLAEDRTYSAAFLLNRLARRNASSRGELKAAYERLVEAGGEALFYLPGDPQLGNDNLGTVDGSHPTDLGFMRMADAFEPVLRTMLKQPK